MAKQATVWVIASKPRNFYLKTENTRFVSRHTLLIGQTTQAAIIAAMHMLEGLAQTGEHRSRNHEFCVLF